VTVQWFCFLRLIEMLLLLSSPEAVEVTRLAGALALCDCHMGPSSHVRTQRQMGRRRGSASRGEGREPRRGGHWSGTQGCSFLTLIFFSLGRTGQPRGRAKTMGAWRSAAAVSCGCGQQVNNGREGRLVLRILSRSNCLGTVPNVALPF
jgi:hypothetical protein